jgi:hypothetical protein
MRFNHVTSNPMRIPHALAVFGVVTALFASSPLLGAQAVDSATALNGLRDAMTACTQDAGTLWGRSLCGPIALVDRQTRLTVASDSVTGRHFIPYAGAYLSTLPADRFLANTAFPWGGTTWTMVMLPLPRDRYSRIALVMHEVFHREQAPLGLGQIDALNNHLDMREGRTWLRLEYRALAAALDVLPDTVRARPHLEDALVFRAERRALYPGADSLEATLEIQEGLPEYTGQYFAMKLTGEGPARVGRYVRDYEKTPTFVRAFAYGTGPALGTLLDAFAPGWRVQVREQRDHRDLGGMLAAAIRFRAPSDPASSARARAGAYDWAQVDREEAARDSARTPAMRDYTRRLVTGPTLTFRQVKDSLSWGYDPTALIGFDMTSTVYPFGNFSAPWGTLTVERGGVLLRNDFSTIRVPAPVPVPADDARSAAGDGWTLTLNAGWHLRPDPSKPGSLVVSR